MNERRSIALFRQFKNARSIPLGHAIKRCLAIKMQFEDLGLRGFNCVTACVTVAFRSTQRANAA